MRITFHGLFRLNHDNGMRATQNALAANKVDTPEHIKELALKRLEADKWNIKNNAARRAHELQAKTDEWIDVADFAETAYQRTVADTLAKIDRTAVEREKPHTALEGTLECALGTTGDFRRTGGFGGVSRYNPRRTISIS